MKVTRLLLLSIFSATFSFAGIITYTAPLNGANENPATGSPGTGFAIVTIDNVAQTMEVNVTFSGLVAGNTAAHIHCCVAPGGNTGVATITPTFTGFPSGTTSGSYDHVFDLTSAGTYNPAFITLQGGTVASAEAVLLAGLAGNLTYLNIHSTVDPGGEIRGFLVATPEPGSWLLSLAGLGILWGATRRRASKGC
jgi:hypothetical protein